MLIYMALFWRGNLGRLSVDKMNGQSKIKQTAVGGDRIFTVFPFTIKEHSTSL